MALWDRLRTRSRPVAAAEHGPARKAISYGELPTVETGTPPYTPAVPPQTPHAVPYGRPNWWSAALPQSRLLYPDDSLNKLLEEMRRTVPIVDRAITTIVGLCGKPVFTGAKGALPDFLAWTDRVKVNQTGRGLQTWLETHLDCQLHYGKGVGEIVPSHELRDIYALCNLDPRSIVLQVTPDPLYLIPYQRQRTNAFLAPLAAELILMSVHGSQTDSPHGHSMLRSVPFVARAARIIENATAQVWQRMGCPPIHINWDPGPALNDPSNQIAQSVLADLKTKWTNVMAGRDPSLGTVSDYFTAGHITCSVIGHDHTPLPLTETWRTFEEQLVCATGLPAWLLGFHWSNTERLALQQAEILVAEIESIRRHVQPALEQLVELRQRFAGKSAKIKVGWTPMSLHDLTEQARGAAWQEQARMRQISNATTMWQLGWIDQLTAYQMVDPDADGVARTVLTPPILPGSGSNVVTPNEDYTPG